MAGITTAAIGAGTALYTSKKASSAARDQNRLAEEAMERADPYAPYRDEAAQRLNKLIEDPSSIENTATYKARQQAAARTMAAQGYTGSGNAILAATDAAAESYQQEFNNLAALAGATQGLQNASSVYSTAASSRQQGIDNRLSATAGLANNITNLASQIFNKPAQGG